MESLFLLYQGGIIDTSGGKNWALWTLFTVSLSSSLSCAVHLSPSQLIQV